MTNIQKEINYVIDKFIGKKGILIPLLQEIQDIERYLSKETMSFVAKRTGIKLAEIYGVATFYSMFRLKPQGEHIIRICKGTACHVSNANSIMDSLRNNLTFANSDEDTTTDGKFTLMEVACLGCCSLAPVIMVDEDTFGKLTSESIAKILKKYD
ncbi:MAG: NADH-quinone oxidoreductase subunit NuoE [Candidatus Cloacimonetes bacterium]|nr:NADH-quinone oxidoreductase subunit NuoE [Candidatus Cloacimonadota bacterium]